MAENTTKPYAEAIITIARSEDALDAVDDELLRIAQVVRDNQDLHDALTNAQHPLARRLKVVDEVLEAAHPVTKSIMAMLVASGKARHLEEIAREVAEHAAEERGRDLAEVYVAVPLDEERKKRLQEALEKMVGRELEMKVFVDESVMGGVRAQIGNTLIDGTVARRLDEIRDRLREG